MSQQDRSQHTTPHDTAVSQLRGCTTNPSFADDVCWLFNMLASPAL